MKPSEYIARWQDEFTAVRRDLHAHPELGFEEHRTARVVQERLAALGIEHHTGIGQHRHRRGDPRRAATRAAAAIGLRADMDALPMQEENDFAHKSRYDGPHARLRPRRAHDDAARRGALPARDAQLRRHRVPHLPAGRGGLRRREGDDRATASSSAFRPSRSTRCTTGRACRPGRSASRRAPRWRRPTGSRSRSTARAATARIRTRRSTRCWSPATSSRRRSRSSAATSSPIDTAVVSLCAMQAGHPGAMSVIPSHAQAGRHRAHVPARRRRT